MATCTKTSNKFKSRFYRSMSSSFKTYLRRRICSYRLTRIMLTKWCMQLRRKMYPLSTWSSRTIVRSRLSSTFRGLMITCSKRSNSFPKCVQNWCPSTKTLRKSRHFKNTTRNSCHRRKMKNLTVLTKTWTTLACNGSRVHQSWFP